MLLRLRRQRPSRRAAEQRDKLAAPHHSITSSAMASSVGGPLFCILSLPRDGWQVLGGDLNRSESS